MASTDQAKKISREWYRNHYEKVLWYSARRRAIKKGIPFTIKVEDIVIPKHCPVLGIPIGPHSKPCDNSASIDRIDSNKGYTKDNIVVVSFKVNTMKSNGSIEDMKKIVNYYQTLGF